MKQARGGGPLEVDVALRDLNRAHPNTNPVSSEDFSYQRAAAQEAAKFLCP